MTAQERIIALLEALNIGPIEMANETGLQRNRIFDLSRGKVKKISLEVANGISRRFPTVNKDWLLYGHDDMMLKEAPTEQSGDDESIKKYKTIINELLSVISTQNAQLERASQDLNRALDTINELAKNKKSSTTRYMVAEDINDDEQ